MCWCAWILRAGVRCAVSPRRVSVGRPGSLGDVVCSRVGLKDGSRVLGLLWAWMVFLEGFGRFPTLPELSGVTKRSEAQWYRDRALFERAFPGEDPEVVVRRVLVAVKARQRRPSTALGLAGVSWAVV